MTFFFNLCVAVLGLTLPGYLLARLFRLEHSWATAFPLSALFIVEALIFFSITGIPIRFGSMSGALLLGVFGSLAARRICRPAHPVDSCRAESSELPPRLVAAVLIVAGAIIVIMAFRATLFPLRGLDTSFRWEGLARAMLQQQSIDFYPPVSAGDFAIYLYPDGIPPLVASVYWWIYAALGAPLSQATSISVVLQLVATMALAFYAARHAFGTQVACFTLLALACCPLFFNGFAIGQETGFTSLAVAGQLCFAAAAVRRPRLSTVIVAALFAALGSLARDYGPALALTGFLMLAWSPATRRYLPTFVLVAVLLSAPWYLRNWALTGNPFFSHKLPGGFEVNAIHAAIMDYYRKAFAFGQLDREHWLSLARQLFTGGALAICVGIPYALVRWRDSTPLLLTATVVTLLWIYSVGQTAGGVLYSTRVLTPAAVPLSIAVGTAFSRLYQTISAQRAIVRQLAIAGAILLSVYSLASALIYPYPSRFFSTAITSTPTGSIQQAMVDRLEASDLPPTGILTDLPFVAETMKRSSRFRPVMYWSPEVAFVLDRHLEPNEIQRRLISMNVRLVLIDAISPNNPFLARYDFFRKRTNWRPLLEIENEAAVFYFEPQ